MSTELPVPLLRSLLLSMETMGFDGRSVFGRLSKPRPRKAQERFEELLSALETFFSVEGVTSTQKMIQTFTTRNSLVLRVAELLGDLRQLLAALLEAAGRQEFIKVEARPAQGEGMGIRIELKRPIRGSLVFFQSIAWALAALPRIRGLPDARVLVERLTDRELHCLVVLPVDRHLRLGLSDTAHRQEAREQLECQAPSNRSLQALMSRWDFTHAEARLVKRLADGKTIKQIAEELRVSHETARTHAKRAMNKTNTHRQAELVSLVLSDE